MIKTIREIEYLSEFLSIKCSKTLDRFSKVQEAILVLWAASAHSFTSTFVLVKIDFFFVLTAIRVEQDIFVRLVDSATKQVRTRKVKLPRNDKKIFTIFESFRNFSESKMCLFLSITLLK